MADLIQSLPLVALTNGATISMEAVDPSSGAAVSGVIVSRLVITAEQTQETVNVDGQVPGPYMLVPGQDGEV